MNPPLATSVIRKAYIFQLKPGCAAEYKRRHNPIWSDLEALLKSQGAHNYSIFHHEDTGQLFACVEIEDETRWAEINETELARRWGSYMAEVMAIQPDGKPVAHVLHEVFHLE